MSGKDSEEDVMIALVCHQIHKIHQDVGLVTWISKEEQVMPPFLWFIKCWTEMFKVLKKH